MVCMLKISALIPAAPVKGLQREQVQGSILAKDLESGYSVGWRPMI